MFDPTLSIQGLKTFLYTRAGLVRAVDGLELTISEGECLGLVGESGCGKTMTALSIMRLVPQPPGRIVAGNILLGGQDLLEKSEREMRRIRGNKLSMIFQEPTSSLNPAFTVGNQIEEVLVLHRGLSRKGTRDQAREILNMVRIPDPDKALRRYPHELSGGMQQRVMIAMALSCKPILLIADEPTTALDVTTQAQILNLINDLRKEMNTSILYITHNLGVVAWLCDRAGIMYAGKIIELCKIRDLFKEHMHPYTQGLLNAIPRTDREYESLIPITGMVPNLIDLPPGCRFHPRCDRRLQICSEKEPPLLNLGSGHFVACWLYA